MTRAERFAILALAFVIFGGGLFPQPGMASRDRASDAVVGPPAGAVEH